VYFVTFKPYLDKIRYNSNLNNVRISLNIKGLDMNFKSMALSALLIVSLFSGCDNKKEKVEADDVVAHKAVQQEDQFSFDLTTTDGKTIKIIPNKEGWKFVGYENKVVLLTFFATWCPPCKAEIPHLVALNEKYKDKFAVIAVVVEQNKPNEQMKQFIAEHHINYPIANSDVNFELANAVGGVSSIPAMFLFNKTGQAVQHYVGAVPEELLESDIKKAFGN
jgi:thiol-disulfide isomerase/thioredoxin